MHNLKKTQKLDFFWNYLADVGEGPEQVQASRRYTLGDIIDYTEYRSEQVQASRGADILGAYADVIRL